MKKPEAESLPTQEDPKGTTEQAWLESRLTILWPMADFHFGRFGRGAIIINVATKEALSDSAGKGIQLHYAGQAEIEQEADEASQRLAEFVRTYDPDREFVAVIIRPNLEISINHMRVGEKSIRAVQAANFAEGRMGQIKTAEELAAAQRLHEQFDPVFQQLLRDLNIDSRE